MRLVPALVLAAVLAAVSTSVLLSVTSREPARREPDFVASRTARPDFSGTWILDVERSWVAAPDRERLPAETLVVKQTASALSFEGDNRELARTQTIALDSPLRKTVGGMAVAVDPQWADGRLLVASWLGNRNFSRSTHLTWSISRDGRKLTINGTQTDRRAHPNETVSVAEIMRVYRKQ